MIERTLPTSVMVRVGLVLLVGTVAVSSVSAGNWDELGPAPINDGSYAGRMSAIAASPSGAYPLYAGGADGGIWRIPPTGGSWEPCTDGLPSSAIGALAMDPTDETILYAGTGEANYANHSRYGLGLYKTTDAGDTWTQLAEGTFAGRCFSRIVINPNTPQTLYAAITRAGGFPELAAARGHPLATGPLGVFRSTDGGVNWTQLTNGLPNLCATDLAIDPNSPNVLYAGIGRIFGSPDNGIYKTTDGGDSWTKLVGGLPTSNVGRISVAVAPSMPSRLYALITEEATSTGGSAETLGAYRSDDSGATWTPLPSLGNIQATYGWYLSVVTVRPTNPNVVIMGGVTLHRSIDAGATWSAATPPHVDLHALAWDGQGRLLAGDDGGVHRSSNLGYSWLSINADLGTIQFYAGISTDPASPSVLLGGTQDNGSIRRSEDGLSWVQVFGGDGGWTQIDQTSPNRLFVEYQGSGNLFLSTDGGDSTSFAGSGISASDRNCFLPPYVINPNNSNVMLYGTHRVYRSTNGGTSWSPFSADLTGGDPASIQTLAYAPSDPNTVYAATNDGRVLRSMDGGANFDIILTDLPGWPRVTRELFVHPGDPLTLYVGVAYFGVDQVRRTTDGGQNWETLDGDLPDYPVNTVAVDVRGATPIIYAGTDFGVYWTRDEGRRWQRFGENFPRTAVIDFVIEPGRDRMLAATQGRGVWQTSIGVMGDLNCDGVADIFDIDAFVAAIINVGKYTTDYPTCHRGLADCNGDGLSDLFDLDCFVELITE